MYIEYYYKVKLTITEKWLSRLVVFHNIVVLPIVRERGNPLPDIKNPSHRQLLMTPLSVSFKATLKAMNKIKFKI